MGKILVWHQGALGDLLLSLPAIAALRNNRRQQLHIVSRTDISDILVDSGIAETITSNESPLFFPLHSGERNVPERLREFLGAYREAYVFAQKSETPFCEAMNSLIENCVFIKPFPPPGQRTHATEYQLDQLRKAGIATHGKEVPFSPARPRPVENLVTVHPGSGGRRKRWPLDKYLALMERLSSESSCSFYVTLGPAEADDAAERIRRYASERHTEATVITGKTVSFVASLIRRSSLYVGNDSGITHLSAATGTPTVAIFGPTDHRVWAPRGENVRIVRSALACSPCEEESYRDCHGLRCLNGLGVDMVLREIRHILPN